MEFLTIDNAKTSKGESLGYLTGIMYLAPSIEAIEQGVANACPFASKGCAKACLFTAGRGAFNSIKQARINKSVKLMGGLKWNDKPHAEPLARLKKDIEALIRKANREGMKPAVRLNGTSDYPVHTWGIMESFPDVQFYDYTKDKSKYSEYLAGNLPSNYHLTFSKSESNDLESFEFLDLGGLVAMVFAGELPSEYKGHKVLNGDESDLTFTRGAGILGLKAKGKARKDLSGFVIQA